MAERVHDLSPEQPDQELVTEAAVEETEIKPISSRLAIQRAILASETYWYGGLRTHNACDTYDGLPADDARSRDHGFEA